MDVFLEASVKHFVTLFEKHFSKQRRGIIIIINVIVLKSKPVLVFLAKDTVLISLSVSRWSRHVEQH